MCVSVAEHHRGLGHRVGSCRATGGHDEARAEDLVLDRDQPHGGLVVGARNGGRMGPGSLLSEKLARGLLPRLLAAAPTAQNDGRVAQVVRLEPGLCDRLTRRNLGKLGKRLGRQNVDIRKMLGRIVIRNGGCGPGYLQGFE